MSHHLHRAIATPARPKSNTPRIPVTPRRTEKRYEKSLSDEEAVRQARLLQAIADPTRLNILHLLMHYPGELAVEEIVEQFDKSQPTLSHHLRIMRDAGLVTCKKHGLFAYYQVVPEKMHEIHSFVYALLCKHGTWDGLDTLIDGCEKR